MAKKPKLGRGHFLATQSYKTPHNDVRRFSYLMNFSNYYKVNLKFLMVGVAGLEPATSRSQSAHSKPTELYPDYICEIIQQT